MLSVKFGKETSYAFRFDCTQQNGILRVTTHATGPAADRTATWSEPWRRRSSSARSLRSPAVAGDASHGWAPLPGGSVQEVLLTGVAGHCTVAGAELVGAGVWRKSGTVVASQVTEVTFDIDCPSAGSVLVTIATGGEAVDPDGYDLTVGTETRHVSIEAANGSKG